MGAKADGELDDLFERWADSATRSIERRQRPRTTRRPRPSVGRGVIAAGAATLLAVFVGGMAVHASEGVPGLRAEASRDGGSGPAPAAESDGADGAAKPVRQAAKVPSAAALRDAWRFAKERGGQVSVAVVDSEGKLRGRDENQRYASASVVKAMLLAAEVRRLKQAGESIDSTTDSLLTSMITISDNAAADAIYSRVGDDGLNKIARRAGMNRFTVAGYWGNAQIAAGDMARFFGDLDRVLVRKHREYAKGLLGSVTETQSWGIPQAAGDRWAVRFKGGWLPDHALVHQAAELRERKGDRELSIAILTDVQPSFEYGIDTVRGVAERLLSQKRDGGP